MSDYKQSPAAFTPMTGADRRSYTPEELLAEIVRLGLDRLEALVPEERRRLASGAKEMPSRTKSDD